MNEKPIIYQFVLIVLSLSEFSINCYIVHKAKILIALEALRILFFYVKCLNKNHIRTT